MRERQQSSTAHPISFLLILSTDHLTGATGKAPAATISKDGGAFSAPAGAVTEIGNGWYSLAGNATDRNTLGEFKINATCAGCDPCDEKYSIVAYDPFDVNIGLQGLKGLTNPAAGALATVGAGAGQINLAGGSVQLSPAGLDLVLLESGLNARQSLSLLSAIDLGNATGLGTTAVAFAGAGVSTPRVSAVLDSAGNRTVTLHAPV